jgi:NOL1/NOP2/fmu family ribosome biogenesis protein
VRHRQHDLLAKTAIEPDTVPVKRISRRGIDLATFKVNDFDQPAAVLPCLFQNAEVNRPARRLPQLVVRPANRFAEN